MTVLALETSTDAASVAVWKEGSLFWERRFGSSRSHSRELFPILAEARDCAGPIARIAVGIGPGSFAGVRISIAAALGMQCVWGCELVGIPSVALLGGLEEHYRAVGDARRGAWYYSRVEGGVCVDGPRLLENGAALEAVLAEGEGPVFTSDASAESWGAQLRVPGAAQLAELAALDRGIVQRDLLEPLYLREAHITLPGSAKKA